MPWAHIIFSKTILPYVIDGLVQCARSRANSIFESLLYSWHVARACPQIHQKILARNLVHRNFSMWIFFCPPVVNITNKATQLSKDAFRSAGCLFPYRWGFVAVQCGRASPRKWRLLLFRCRRIERRCQFRFSSSSEAAKHNVGNGNVSNNDSST